MTVTVAAINCVTQFTGNFYRERLSHGTPMCKKFGYVRDVVFGILYSVVNYSQWSHCLKSSFAVWTKGIKLRRNMTNKYYTIKIYYSSIKMISTRHRINMFKLRGSACIVWHDRNSFLRNCHKANWNVTYWPDYFLIPALPTIAPKLEVTLLLKCST